MHPGQVIPEDELTAIQRSLVALSSLLTLISECYAVFLPDELGFVSTDEELTFYTFVAWCPSY